MRTVRLTKESTKDILENLLKRSPNNYGKFEAAVADILANVKEKGDEALFSYTKEFDKVEVTPETIRVTEEEIEEIKRLAFKVNDVMKDFFKKLNVDLIDFKLEFGRLSDGKIVLADEISPDTCRFWDSTTHEKLDKDRFRRDLGNVEDAYAEMMKRILG